jgi:hypothetical protein
MENEIAPVNDQKTWDDIGGDYIKLEKDKAKVLLLIDWSLAHIEKFKDDAGNLKKQIEFSAKVLSEDGKPAKKVFTTTSINALKGLKEVFYMRDNKKPILVRIKKIGEGKSTIYDIEEQKLTK